ncbi:MAG: hypothetical protein AAFN00_05120 [Cyanobacteria bacterium J06558_2]
MFDLKAFFDATPPAFDRGLAIGVGVGLGGLLLGAGVAIGRSSRVVVNGDGVIIQQQAIANQERLEHSLFLVKTQRGIIERLEQDIVQFSAENMAGEGLAVQAQFAAEVIKEADIEELEQDVEESKAVLDEVLPH